VIHCSKGGGSKVRCDPSWFVGKSSSDLALLWQSHIADAKVVFSTVKVSFHTNICIYDVKMADVWQRSKTLLNFRCLWGGKFKGRSNPNLGLRFFNCTYKRKYEPLLTCLKE